MEWGRQTTCCPACYVFGCPEQATYWVTYTAVRRKSGRVPQLRTFCGPHFRHWMDRHYTIEQMTLFGASAAGMAGAYDPTTPGTLVPPLLAIGDSQDEYQRQSTRP